MRRAALFLFILFSSVAASAQRLPDTVVPQHYSLWFAPDLRTATFRGRETIQVQMKAASREIVLHAAEITFGEIVVTAAGGAQPARVTLDAARETATLTVARPLPAGPATIQITYTGILNDKLRGFYLSKANGRSYAVSQLEATDARRAFPSFDEPAYKATFDISLMVDQGDTVISNGTQLSDTPGPEPGKHTVTFARTAKMSSYLVAMLVGDFVCREGTADDIPVRICSTPDKQALTGFALEAALQQLQFYNRYFGTRYPFGKLDIIAVPDFSAGAMENTAAITFRERLLLADPSRASVAVRKNIARVISHEIAHQWFGDLVTMKWWDDIWLNEGFATWMAHKPIAEWKPEWRVELDGVEETMTAKATDSLRTTRPVRMDVETPDEINQVFDAIAYQKGSAVLRMIETFVGPELFRKGVASYLQKYAYANASAEDFWNELTRVTGKPVDRIMKTFIDQAGIPVVSVRGGGDGVTLRQERFIGTPGAAPPAAPRWVIPVCFKDAGEAASRCEVVAEAAHTVSAPGGARADAPFANANSRGYYFTEYTPEAARALARTADTTLTPAERLGLLGDEWWMARSGRHDVGIFLDVAAAMSDDDTAAITEQIHDRLAFINAYLVPAAQRQAFAQWVRERFTREFEAIDFPGSRSDSDETQERRATLLALLGGTGSSPEVQRQARDAALRYIDDPESLSGTLVPTVLSVAAYSGDAALYDRYVAQLKKPGLAPEEYYRFFNALASFSDPSLVSRTLQFALSSDVRTQDSGTLLGQLLGSAGGEIAWRFTQAEWPTIVAKLGTFQQIPGIARALQGFCSSVRADEIRQFFARNPVPAAERALQQSVERIEACTAVQARQSPALSAWLAAQR